MALNRDNLRRLRSMKYHVGRQREMFVPPHPQLLLTQLASVFFLPSCPLINPGASVKPVGGLTPNFGPYCVLCHLSTVSWQRMPRWGEELRPAPPFCHIFPSSLFLLWDFCKFRHWAVLTGMGTASIMGGASSVGGQGWQG